MTDLRELAEKTVAYVMRLGPSDCDVLVSDSRQMTAEIEKGSMKQASTVNDPGVAIRAFKDGSSGFAYCTGFDVKKIRKVADLAVAQAKAGTPDPDFKGLPEKKRPTAVKGLYQRALSELESDDVVALAIELADLAGGDKRITSVNAGVGVGSGSAALANSNGVASYQEMTSFEVSAEAVARSGKEMFSGVDGGWSRRIERSLLERVGASAREHALLGLTHARIGTGDYPVIFDPLALGFLLSTAIAGGANADSVQRKRSYLAGRLGSRIGSELFTVHDDPTLEWAVGSFKFDGEGTPAERTAVVKKGVLSSFLYDSYTAGKDGVKSTGNSSRGAGLWGFRRPPSISSSNIVVSRGGSSFDEMVEETKEGVFLRITYDYPNLATGEFSGLMMESLRIHDGELGASLRQATIGVSLVELFSRIDMVGNDSRYVFGVQTPALRISKARIGGSS